MRQVKCFPRPPTSLQRHMDLHAWSYPQLSVAYIEIRPGVSEPPAGRRKLAFPITLAIGFYNSLYCRTSRDESSKYSINP